MKLLQTDNLGAYLRKMAIDYICNPDKMDDKVLISSYGCSYETADIEFGFMLSKARDKGDNLGHHIIQSFAPREVSNEEVHRIGKELASDTQ